MHTISEEAKKMQVTQLLASVAFREQDPLATPLFIDHVGLTGRIIRFALRAGQSIKEHQAPHSPVYIVVLKGHGYFAGANGREQLCGPETLLVFDTGETHAIRADKEDLVFVTFLHGVPEEITR
jgi:quercetin dioxygenase-like cupin family protein